MVRETFDMAADEPPSATTRIRPLRAPTGTRTTILVGPTETGLVRTREESPAKDTHWTDARALPPIWTVPPSEEALRSTQPVRQRTVSTSGAGGRGMPPPGPA